MNILIADKLASSTVEALEKMGGQITVNPDLSADDLPTAIGNSEILIVRSTKVTADTINKGQNLSLIIRAGAGVNTIDLNTASERGVYVTNCPGKNTHAVAELALGLLIAADRRIAAAHQDLTAGKWRKKEYGKARGLKGRTLGIIGLGSIGQALAVRAKGLEMNVIAWSRSLSPERAEALGLEYAATPLDVARQADAISLHLAATADTKHLINEAFLSAMQPGAILVNTARGDVVDTEALKKAITEKGLRVGLDVYENEPTGGDAAFPFIDLTEIVTCTPHIGASTDQASEATAAEVVNIVAAYRKTGTPLNVVNLRASSGGGNTLVVRHYNKVGVLAGVLNELRNAGINIEEMQNTIFDGDAAASCSLTLDKKPDPDTLSIIANAEYIVQVGLK